MRFFPWVFVLLLLAHASAAQERIWSWKDKAGVVHYTDDPEQLPEPLRSEALRELEKNPPPKKAPEPAPPAGEPVSPEPSDTAAPSAESSGSAVEKARQRRELKASVERKHASYLELKKSCDDLEEKLSVARRDGRAVYGLPSGGVQAAEAEGKLKKCRDDLSRAREDLMQEMAQARRMGVSIQVDFDR